MIYVGFMAFCELYELASQLANLFSHPLQVHKQVLVLQILWRLSSLFGQHFTEKYDSTCSKIQFLAVHSGSKNPDIALCILLQMCQQLTNILHEAGKEDIGVVMITGTGDYFCSGLDYSFLISNPHYKAHAKRMVEKFKYVGIPAN